MRPIAGWLPDSGQLDGTSICICSTTHWFASKSHCVAGRRNRWDLLLPLTGDSFADGTLPQFITETLERNDLPASSIILEITEQVAIGSVSQAIPQITQLVKLGCEFAVDDFGTGYSSLSYLKKLPVQYIKIDGAFIQKLTEDKADQTIVKAVSDIARLLGKSTVAEYIEDEKTLNLVRKLGVDYAQGFFIGKPTLTPWSNLPTKSRIVQLATRV